MYKWNNSVCFSVCPSETQFIECYVPSMYFHYDGGFAFAPPVRRDYGEGTLDERREPPHAYVTKRLYVGARRAKRGQLH